MSTGEDRKDLGQLRTWENEPEEWKEYAIEVVKFIAATSEDFTCDDVRAAILSAGGTEPHHPNVWGSLLRTAGRRGFIEKTGAYRKSATVSRHAGMIAVWKASTPEEGEQRGEEKVQEQAGTQLEIRAPAGG